MSKIKVNEIQAIKGQKSENGFNRNSQNGDSAHVEETKPDEIILPEDSENEEIQTPVADKNHEIPEEEGGEDAEETPKKRSKLPFIIIGAIVFIGAIGGLIYWLDARNYESTDDAFIDGDIIQVSPKVTAYVKKIYVDSNATVHKGDLLVELDTKDFEAKLEQAKATLLAAQAQKNQSQAEVSLTRATTNASQSQANSGVEVAQNNVEQTRQAAEAKQSQIRQAQDAVKTAQANLAQTKALGPQVKSELDLAQKEYDRELKLFNSGDVSKQSLDLALNNLKTAQAQAVAAQKKVLSDQAKVGEAQANVSVAQNNYQQALAQVEVTKSQVGQTIGQLQDANAAPQRIDVSQTQVGNADAAIAQAEAAVHQAELELSYAKIYAPEDGMITKKTIEEGQIVQAGTPLLAISQSDEIWVIANFKETQLELMRIGQPVDIEVDAYPSETFHGKIESFQAGTGSRFSLLPAENATGNYVKVVQRVPVKIVFDRQPEADDAHLLAPGMSVEPSVKVR